MSAKKDETHEIVPEHSKLSDKESKDLFNQFNVTIREMPKILVSDPAIVNLNVKEGDVVKIVRNSRTAGESIFYRGVVKD